MRPNPPILRVSAAVLAGGIAFLTSARPAAATEMAVSAGSGPDAESLAQLVVYILVVIALLLLVLTIWYWNRTRPEKQRPPMVEPARAVAPNQVVVPHPQPATPQPVSNAGHPWGQAREAPGPAHTGPQWRNQAPVSGPRWDAASPAVDPSVPLRQAAPRPAPGPEWGDALPRR